MEKERRKIEKARWKWKEEKFQNEKRVFFFVFFPLSFHFWKPLKFILGLPNGNFLPGKSISRWGKKSGKMMLPTLKNFPLLPLTTTVLTKQTALSSLQNCRQKHDFLIGLVNSSITLEGNESFTNDVISACLVLWVLCMHLLELMCHSLTKPLASVQLFVNNFQV